MAFEAQAAPVLEVRHVEKVYGSRNNVTRALADVSFTVNKGEFVGIMGASGSGKSTLLNCVSTIDTVTSGSVIINGADVTRLKQAKLTRFRREQLGFIFQDSNLLDTLTARENIYLNGALLGYTEEFIDAHFQEIIDFAELPDFVDMPMKNFSSGRVARIAFAIAAITEPDILIVDETLSVGDVFFQEKCERRIQHFIEDGNVTVLFVSHSMDQVERICQRAVWIEKGDLRMDGPVDEVCKAYRVQFA